MLFRAGNLAVALLALSCGKSDAPASGEAPNPQGGLCNDDPGATTDACYDGWGTALVPLDTSWRLYQIPFSRIAQRAWGYQGEALDTANLYDLEWGVTQNTVFDLWVDDLWFYE